MSKTIVFPKSERSCSASSVGVTVGTLIAEIEAAMLRADGVLILDVVDGIDEFMQTPNAASVSLGSYIYVCRLCVRGGFRVLRSLGVTGVPKVGLRGAREGRGVVRGCARTCRGGHLSGMGRSCHRWVRGGPESVGVITFVQSGRGACMGAWSRAAAAQMASSAISRPSWHWLFSSSESSAATRSSHAEKEPEAMKKASKKPTLPSDPRLATAPDV